MSSTPPLERPHGPPAAVEVEQRWPALLAVLAVGGVHYALPEALSIGPSWLLLAVVVALGVPAEVTHRTGHHAMNRVLGFVVQGVITVALIYSVIRLLGALPRRSTVPPADLLRAAAVIWATNVIVFASWYWRLDAGGPNQRDHRRRSGVGHTRGAFLFPQMTMDGRAGRWSPEFVDYLFLAFNTSTAFSPTDAPVLSRWAKLLMMVQSVISFTTVVLLAARAVNVL